MKKNARRKANLQLLDPKTHERYVKLGNEVNIKEIHIRPRKSVDKDQGIKRNHRSKISELKGRY